MDVNRFQANGPDMPQLPAMHKGRAGTSWLRVLLWVEKAWADFLFLVLPTECVVCGREDHSLCPACSALLRKQTARPYRAEQSADALVGVWGESHLPVMAAGVYRDALSASILGFKNHGRTELAVPLCRGLAKSIEAMRDSLQAEASHGGTILLVPIPSSGGGWRRRGYDPLALLLKSLRQEGRLSAGLVVAPVLRSKVRPPWHSAHQKGLGRAARRRNVRNTMKIRRNWSRRIRLLAYPNEPSVLLLDDVLTTGSTLAEAAKTLEKRGNNVLGAVVLAAARAPEGTAENLPGNRSEQNTFQQKMNKTMQ